MGYKTIAMTCRYAHLAPEYLQDDILKLDGWGKKSLIETDTITDTGGLSAHHAPSDEAIKVTVQ
jgi:hypothetical protein